MPDAPTPSADPGTTDAHRAYWRANLRTVGALLVVWFLVSYGCGILFADWLDQFRIGGFKLGFWFSQQGSIYTFVALIFVYVRVMNRLDRRYGVADDDSAEAPAEEGGQA